jgi:hypothetical protein
MVVVEAGILCWLVCYVRGGDQHFGELNTCAGYTPPRNNRVVYPVISEKQREDWYTPPGNNRVVYQFMASPFGIHHPEITGFYHS